MQINLYNFIYMLCICCLCTIYGVTYIFSMLYRIVLMIAVNLTYLIHFETCTMFVFIHIWIYDKVKHSALHFCSRSGYHNYNQDSKPSSSFHPQMRPYSFILKCTYISRIRSNIRDLTTFQFIFCMWTFCLKVANLAFIQAQGTIPIFCGIAALVRFVNWTLIHCLIWNEIVVIVLWRLVNSLV